MEYTIIGLMSGTSLDGLDIACVHFRKNDRPSQEGSSGWHYEILHAESIPYTAEWREKLRGAYYLTAEGIVALDAEYGRYLGTCVKDFMERLRERRHLCFACTVPSTRAQSTKHAGECRHPHLLEDIDFVASHGHTVFHRPDAGYNLQIGHGAHLHAASGVKVICDFRTLDIAFGGQGAPLVPIGDKLLFGEYDYCLNIGGFANVSFDDPRGNRIAYDLCPVNFCLNRLMRTRGQEYDRDGQTARAGVVNPALFEALNALDYYHRPAPKSLSQEWVDACVTPLLEQCDDKFENMIATLTEHAAYQIARPFAAGSNVFVTGGGSYNVYLLERALHYGDFRWIKPADAVVDFKEALIFAFLGLLRAEGLPNCLQSVTGARKDVVSGVLYGFTSLSS